ncbi:MAG: class I SAM-dependent methyltransferase [Clostridium sp.]|nr:class I SAM-dependent methyltransferase [Clostridium sp.]
MSKLNLDFYKGADLYSDGDIETKMLDIAQNNIDISCAKVEYPVFYHFSPIRYNILSWYPFKENCTIIEIGSGCGAMTGLLCSRASRVVAVELSKRRAEINLARNGSFANLEIIVGNLNDIVLEEKFDYVIVNGVMEYAAGFIEAEKPYDAFLQKVKTLQKKDGKLLLAIENRLGLKYFAGAPEDHTGEFFLGLKDYQGNDLVRTFSKCELIKLLEDNGYPCNKFYYPYPDYKFPLEIFTDETLTADKYGTDYYNYAGERFELFNEGRVARAFISEGIMDKFVNSFLVEASVDKFKNDTEIIYVKYSNNRKKEFSIMTIIQSINGKKSVIKKAAYAEANKHLEKMAAISKKDTLNDKIVNLTCEPLKDGISYAFVEEDNLYVKLCRLILENNKSELLKLLQRFFDAVFECSYEGTVDNENFEMVFGEKTHYNKDIKLYHNVDMILENVYERNDKYVVIDYEWIFDFGIPAEFVVWRCIKDLYDKNARLSDIIEMSDMLQECNIPLQEQSVYERWNKHFTEIYVGSNLNEENAVDKKILFLNEVMTELINHDRINTSLYYDLGDGYSEENKIYCDVHREDGVYKVKFETDGLENVKSYRWDPAEGKPCKCKVIKTSGIEIITPVNSVSREDDVDIFMTIDPVYELKACDDVSCLMLEFEYMPLDAKTVDNYIVQLQGQCDMLQGERDRLENSYNDVSSELQNIKASPAYKMVSMPSKIKNKIVGKSKGDVIE